MSLQDLAHKLDPVAWVNDNGLLTDKDGNPARLDATQESILRSTNKRIIINCHRQWGKSQMASFLCLHRAIYHPRSLCLLVAPSLRQSSENFRKILDSLNINAIGSEMLESTKLSLMLPNRSRILALPGSQKTIRGFSRPDIIVIDEAAQAADELYEALFPMFLRNPAGQMILASSSWVKGQGFFYHLWAEGAGWEKVRIRASENAWLDPAILAEARLQLSPSAYKRDYECEFTESEDSLFKYDQIIEATDNELPAMVF